MHPPSYAPVNQPGVHAVVDSGARRDWDQTNAEGREQGDL